MAKNSKNVTTREMADINRDMSLLSAYLTDDSKAGSQTAMRLDRMDMDDLEFAIDLAHYTRIQAQRISAKLDAAFAARTRCTIGR